MCAALSISQKAHRLGWVFSISFFSSFSFFSIVYRVVPDNYSDTVAADQCWQIVFFKEYKWFLLILVTETRTQILPPTVKDNRLVLRPLSGQSLEEATRWRKTVYHTVAPVPTFIERILTSIYPLLNSPPLTWSVTSVGLKQRIAIEKN